MSEIEDLKKATDESLSRSRMKAVSEYIDELSKKIDVCLEESKRASTLCLLVCVLWVALDFLPGMIGFALGFPIYLAALFYMQEKRYQTGRLFGEFRGALHTLELLGIIDPLPNMDGKKKKKRKVLSEMVDTVKKWATEKKKAQDKVFAPA